VRNALELRHEGALALGANPYALFASVLGIGFVLATGIAGELGDPRQLAPFDSLFTHDGIVLGKLLQHFPPFLQKDPRSRSILNSSPAD